MQRESVLCEESELRRCGANGGTFELLDTYLESEQCRADLAACAPDVRAADAPVCNGNTLSKCAADGSGPEPGGTDCGKQVCDRGACRDPICTPDARFCDSGTYRLVDQLTTATTASGGYVSSGTVDVAHERSRAARWVHLRCRHHTDHLPRVAG